MNKPFLFILLIINILACKKATFELQIEVLNSGVSNDLKAVLIQDETQVSAVGGEQWTFGLRINTKDDGKTWQTLNAEKQQLNAIATDLNGTQYMIGARGLLLRKTLTIDTTGACMYPLWYIMNALTFRNAEAFTVGGAAYQDGRIVKYIYKGYWNREGENIDFPQELRDITYVNDTTLVACGYGLVVRSTDTGKTWKTLPIQDDYFLSLHFPSATVGYMVGYHGSILKSIDAGATWTSLRDGDKLTVSDEPFRRVFFRNENLGYIIGDAGLFWRTDDGAKTWKRIETNQQSNFLDIKVTNKGRGYIVGSAGFVAKFQD